VKYWEIIARNLKKRGWSLGYVSAIDSNGRTIWIADAHRDDGRRFVVRAEEKLSAFLQLESAICACGELPRQAGEISPKLPEYETPIPQVLIHHVMARVSPIDEARAKWQPKIEGKPVVHRQEFPEGNAVVSFRETRAAVMRLDTKAADRGKRNSGITDY